VRPLLVLVGPSGAGKSTLARGLVAAGLVDLHRTWTTRPARDDETSERSDHVFVDPAAFSAAEAAGELLVVIELFGHRYGLPPLPTDDDRRPSLLLGREQLLPLIASLHPDPLVYAVTAQVSALDARQHQRSLSPDEQRARAAYDREERILRASRVFDTTASSAERLLDEVTSYLRNDLAARAQMEVTR
jgi:ribose 1,5-bisphosphokinase PhnN